jgi:hypothetical protein
MDDDRPRKRGCRVAETPFTSLFAKDELSFAQSFELTQQNLARQPVERAAALAGCKVHM